MKQGDSFYFQEGGSKNENIRDLLNLVFGKYWGFTDLAQVLKYL